MNPSSATMPAPAPLAAPNQPETTPATTSPINSGPNVVTNIPVHTQQTAPTAANEDAELDQIMHDVGKQLKKEDIKPQHHGLLSFLHHEPKPLVKVNNQASATPVAVQSAPSAAIPVPVNMPAAPAPVLPQAQAQPAAQPQASVKTKTHRHIPVFVIFVALCVTGFLIAAAIAAYKQTS